MMETFFLCILIGIIILTCLMLIFLFMGLGYRVPAYICMAGLYVLVGVFFIARQALEKKM